MGFFAKQYQLNLALQGGGAHGAFTWGVLDRLLEDERIKLGWMSGTSAGAVNAVALASGLAEGGREAAREKLGAIWRGVYKAGVPDLLRFNPFLYSLSKLPAVAQMASLLSPYEFNPTGFDPLRHLLLEQIDFERLQQACPVKLLISATDVATGRARHFRNHEMHVEAVLASACLPTVHHAVQLDGRAYWDGGFSANPDLVTMAEESPVGDTLIVQIIPTTIAQLPTGVRDISDHANTLTFNAPFLRDVEIIETARQTRKETMFAGRGPMMRLAKHRYHLVEATEYTSALKPDTKVLPDWEVLTYLRDSGRKETENWIEKNLNQVGRRSSVDLRKRYLDIPTSSPAKRPQIKDVTAAVETVERLALPPARKRA
ncbi:MAG: patatin-like phospholipase family protein [Alphaproteobacteria bacterium]|nr:patatin-like phospholipase family protein [Alphaproteobacteria bacterium]